MEAVTVVRENEARSINKNPQGAVFTPSDELLLLENEFRRILLLRLDPWTELFRVVLMQITCDAIWYMPSKDGILLLERDPDTDDLTFVFLLNWRIPDRRNRKCSIIPNAKRPCNWRFDPGDPGFHGFALSSFEGSTFPTAQIHENSIVIVSESAAIFWDISDRPILRFVLLLPPPFVRPLFSFLGDRIALITQGTLLILQAVVGPQIIADEPFSPGSKCFELHETLVPLFGVTQNNVNATSLFIVRHLPDRPVNIQIMFEWRPPGEPRQVSFITPTEALLVVTTLGAFACRPILGRYQAGQLSGCVPSGGIQFNRSFLLLSGGDHLQFYPNPEKAELAIDDSFVLLSKVSFRDVLFIANSDRFCLVATASLTEQGDASHKKADIEEATVYVLKYEDPVGISQRLLASPNLQAQKAGLRLKEPNDPDFAVHVLNIGMRLLRAAPPDLASACAYLARAFNSGISDAQREQVLAEIAKIPRQQTRMLFIREAHLRNQEITPVILKLILNLPHAQAIQKLIQAKHFDVEGGFADIPEALLYSAMSASLKGDHDGAREQFLRVPVGLFRWLEDDVLARISDDLPAPVLVAIERPELSNGQWPVAERSAACFFMRGSLGEALRITAEDLQEKWHFEEWPTKPQLCDWVEGSEMMQFAAGCCTYNAVNEDLPPVFSALARAAAFARQGDFAEALTAAGGIVYPFEFLRCFANDPAKWAVIIEQVEDPDIRRCATHYLIASSPKSSYKAVVKRLQDYRPELRDIAQELEKIDLELLTRVSGPRPRQ
jgi:hypothetical protein